MNNNSDINYLIQIKKTLIEEIRIFQNCSSNYEYFNSLPIQNEQVRNSIEKYNLTNSSIHFDDIIKNKRETLKDVNNSLKKFCCHRIIDGNFNLSRKENKLVRYCVLCMNFF